MHVGNQMVSGTTLQTNMAANCNSGSYAPINVKPQGGGGGLPKGN